MLTSLYNWAL